MEFFEIIQKITRSEIIAGFTKFGLKKKISLVNEFDIIGYIMANKSIISKFISEIPSNKLEGLDSVNIHLCSIAKIEQNNIPATIIQNILNLISSHTFSEKTRIIMSLILFGGESCQKYFNGLLDNEIFFVIKKKL
jgi:hypothetical protein